MSVQHPQPSANSRCQPFPPPQSCCLQPPSPGSIPASPRRLSPLPPRCTIQPALGLSLTPSSLPATLPQGWSMLLAGRPWEVSSALCLPGHSLLLGMPAIPGCHKRAFPFPIPEATRSLHTSHTIQLSHLVPLNAVGCRKYLFNPQGPECLTILRSSVACGRNHILLKMILSLTMNHVTATRHEEKFWVFLDLLEGNRTVLSSMVATTHMRLLNLN